MDDGHEFGNGLHFEPIVKLEPQEDLKNTKNDILTPKAVEGLFSSLTALLTPPKRRSEQFCCVPRCGSRTSLGNNFFNVIRSDNGLTKRWVKAINRCERDGSKWEPNNRSRICEKHFVGNEPSKDSTHRNSVPTLNLPADLIPRKRASLDHQYCRKEIPPKALKAESEKQNKLAKDAECNSLLVEPMDTAREALTKCKVKSKSVQNGAPKIENLGITNRVLSSSKKSKDFLGISLEIFDTLLIGLQDKNSFLKMRSLSQKDQLVLFLYKLEANTTYTSISLIFDLHERTVCKVFNHMVNTTFEFLSYKFDESGVGSENLRTKQCAQQILVGSKTISKTKKKSVIRNLVLGLLPSKKS